MNVIKTTKGEIDYYSSKEGTKVNEIDFFLVYYEWKDFLFYNRLKIICREQEPFLYRSFIFA